MKKLLRAFSALIFFAALLALCACSKVVKTDGRWPCEFNGVTFNHAPARVVSLSPAVTDTLYSLGYGGRLRGVSDFCTPPQSADVPSPCGSALLPDIDAVLSASPDMLFTSAELPDEAKKSLAEADVQIVVINRAENLEGILDNYQLIFTAFEGLERGKLLREQMELFAETMLDYVGENISESIPDGASAVYLKKLPFILATGDSFEGVVLSQMGFENPAGGYTGWSFPSDEAESLAPDYIFCDKDITFENIEASSYYAGCAAVKNKAIYQFDMADMERQSPKLFFSLLSLGREAFPEAFNSPIPDFIMDMPEPEPTPEKSWWQKLLPFLDS